MKIFNYLLLFIFIISILPNSFALYEDIPWCNVAGFCNATLTGRLPINVTTNGTEYKIGEWANMRNYLAEAGYDPTTIDHDSYRIVFQDTGATQNGVAVPMNYSNDGTTYDFDWTKQIFFNATQGVSNSSQTYFLYFGPTSVGYTNPLSSYFYNISWKEKSFSNGPTYNGAGGSSCTVTYVGNSIRIFNPASSNHCNLGLAQCATVPIYGTHTSSTSYYTLIRNTFTRYCAGGTGGADVQYIRGYMTNPAWNYFYNPTAVCGGGANVNYDGVAEKSAQSLVNTFRLAEGNCYTSSHKYLYANNHYMYEPNVTFGDAPQSGIQIPAKLNYTTFLYDDFTDNTLDLYDRWDYSSAGITESSQRLQINAPASTTRYVNSTTPYSGGNIDVRLVTAAADSVPAGNSRFTIYMIDRDDYSRNAVLWYTNTTSGVFTNLEFIYDSENNLVHLLEDGQPLRTGDISSFTGDPLFSAKLQSWGVGTHVAYIDNANINSNLGDFSKIQKINNYQDAEQTPTRIKNAGDMVASTVTATSTIGTLGTGSWGSINGNSAETTTLNVTGVTDSGVITPILSGGYDSTETYSTDEDVFYYVQNITEYVTNINITNTVIDVYSDANFTFYFDNNHTTPVNVYGVAAPYSNISNVACFDGGAGLATYPNSTHIRFDGARILNGNSDTYRCAFNSQKGIVTRTGRVQDTTYTTEASLNGIAYSAEQFTLNLDTGYTIPFNSINATYNYTGSISGWNNTAGSGTETIVDGGNFYANFTSLNQNEVVVLDPFYNCQNTTSEDIRDATITYNCTSRVYVNDTIDFTNVLVNNTFTGGTNTTAWEGWTVDATAGTYNETYTYGVTVPGINFTDNGLVHTATNSYTYEILLENPNATTLNSDFVTNVYEGFPVWYAAEPNRANFYLYDNGTDVTANVAYNVGYDATNGNFTFTVPTWSSHNFTMTVTGLSGGGGGGSSGGGGGGSALACPTGSVWDREESRCVIPSILTVEPNTPESRNINVNVGEDHQLKLTITNSNSDDAIDIEVDPKVNWIIAEPYVFTGVKKGESVTTTIKFSREFTPISRAGFIDFLVNNEYDFSIEYQQNIGQLSQIKAGIAAALGMTYEDFIEYWSVEPLGYGPSLALIFVAIIGGVTYLIYNSVKPKKLKDFTLVFILGGFGLVVAYIMLPAITFTLI